MRSFFKNRIFKNASWIIACKIVQSVLSLVVTMLSARYLGPSGYGLISYAASLVSFAGPLMQLGFNSVLVQEIVNNPEKEGEALGSAITTSFITSFLTIGGILSFVTIANRGEKDTLIVCALYSILLIFQSVEMMQYWFQAKLKSKYTSIVMLIAYVLVSAYRIVLLVTGKNIYYFAIAQAIDTLIIAASLLIIYRKIGDKKLSFSYKRVRQIFAKSKYYIISSLMVIIFSQTDKIMIKNMLGDSETGYYTAAVTCASMTSFIFLAIIDSVRPEIFSSKNISVKKFEKNISRLYCIIIYLSLLQCIAITLLASPFIHIVYGKSYDPSINTLRIMVWYSTFSYLGYIRNMWILSEGKQRFLLIINLSGALINVGLNFALIPVWGINGAAFASFATQVFTNVIMGFILPQIRHNNLLMFRGLNIKYLFGKKSSAQAVSESASGANGESANDLQVSNSDDCESLGVVEDEIVEGQPDSDITSSCEKNDQGVDYDRSSKCNIEHL